MCQAIYLLYTIQHARVVSSDHVDVAAAGDGEHDESSLSIADHSTTTRAGRSAHSRTQEDR